MTGKEFDIIVNTMREEGLNSDKILENLSKFFHQKDDPELIRNFLMKLGISSEIGGFECWVSALGMYKAKRNISITGELYPEVAKIHGITPSNVERRMRYAIQYIFERSPRETITSVFGDTAYFKKGIPSNKKCLAILSRQI